MRLVDPGGAGAQHKLLHQIRILRGQTKGNHPALGGAEEGDAGKPQRPDGFRRVPGHLPDGVDGGQILPPVKEIDGKVLCQNLVGLRDQIAKTHYALHAEPRQDHKRIPAMAKAEVIHGKGIGFYGFDGHVSASFPGSGSKRAEASFSVQPKLSLKSR